MEFFFGSVGAVVELAEEVRVACSSGVSTYDPLKCQGESGIRNETDHENVNVWIHVWWRRRLEEPWTFR